MKKNNIIFSSTQPKKEFFMYIFMGFPETAWNFHLDGTNRSREAENTGKQENGFNTLKNKPRKYV